LQAELLLAEKTLVEPVVEDGRTVVYEHHLDSIYAYQAARLVESKGSNTIAAALTRVQRELAPFCTLITPSTTIFLDIDPRIAAGRAAARDKRVPTTKAINFNRLVASAYAILYRDRTIHWVESIDEGLRRLRTLLHEH
jgi:thymidylate kinase